MKTINRFFCRSLMIGAFACLWSANATAVQLAKWDFANWNPDKLSKTTAAPSSTYLNVTVSNLTKGAGIGVEADLWHGNNAFCGTGVQAKNLTQSITRNEYYEFTIAPTAGKFLSISTIDVCAETQGEVRVLSLLSSKSGFTAENEIDTIMTGPANNMGISVQTFNVTGHTNLTTPVTFRIYFHGASEVRFSVMGFGFHSNASDFDFAVNGTSQQEDLLPPTTPGSLAAGSVGATSLRLSWTASADDNELEGYYLYNGATYLGFTTKLYHLVYGLTAETNYTFNVIAKDLSGKQSAPATVNVTTGAPGSAGALPKIPMGMNVGMNTYYSVATPFTDAMKMSGDMMTTYDGGGWNTEKIGEIPRDVNGYPLSLPYATSDGKQTYVKFMLNDLYSGNYVLTFDGVGTISIAAANTKVNDNKYYITFTGNGDNIWLNITSSTMGNHVRNMKILPVEYENSSSYPTFHPKWKEGLAPFHAFRFMDWSFTNNPQPNQIHWADRPTKEYYSQATVKGASFEYAVELCNELDADAWVCVPHLADDDYITQAALLWRDGLRPNRKIYLEYSNELWNWQFVQAQYVSGNAIGHTNAYVNADLAAIAAAGGDYPEKIGYMFARTFKLWKPLFTGVNAQRLVRVAALQGGYLDVSLRIMKYLIDVDKGGFDVASPTSYFGLSEQNHLDWVNRCSTSTPVTQVEMLETVMSQIPGDMASVKEIGNYALEHGVGLVNYEGGQHMQPWMQGEHCYNDTLWEAQIHPKMYDTYIMNANEFTDPQVNSQLFMAFSYMAPRKSKYGSWGHLENMAQIGGDYMKIAPKYQALLDINTPKTPGIMTSIEPAKVNQSDNIWLYPNPIVSSLNIDFGAEVENASVSIFDIHGRNVFSNSGYNTKVATMNVESLSSGVYFVKITNKDKVTNSKFVKK